MRKFRVSIVVALALVFSFSAFGQIGINGGDAFGIAGLPRIYFLRSFIVTIQPNSK